MVRLTGATYIRGGVPQFSRKLNIRKSVFVTPASASLYSKSEINRTWKIYVDAMYNNQSHGGGGYREETNRNKRPECKAAKEVRDYRRLRHTPSNIVLRSTKYETGLVVTRPIDSERLKRKDLKKSGLGTLAARVVCLYCLVLYPNALLGRWPRTMEETNLQRCISCHSPDGKLPLWGRIFLYFVCAQMFGYISDRCPPQENGWR